MIVGVIIKKKGKREYVYLVNREGKKVVHTYIGPATSPRAMQKLQENSETTAVPLKFRSLFWDTGIDKIHIKKNARYIIERVLEFGDIDAIEWLQRVYPAQRIIDVLHLSRFLTEKSRNFWMHWFGAGTA